MIREEWYVVLESTEAGKRPVGVTRLGKCLVFRRDSGGKVVCNYDKCAHRGDFLAGGRVVPVPSGYLLPVYPTHEAHGFIWIWWGQGAPPGPSCTATRSAAE